MGGVEEHGEGEGEYGGRYEEVGVVWGGGGVKNWIYGDVEEHGEG